MIWTNVYLNSLLGVLIVILFVYVFIIWNQPQSDFDSFKVYFMMCTSYFVLI